MVKAAPRLTGRDRYCMSEKRAFDVRYLPHGEQRGESRNGHRGLVVDAFAQLGIEARLLIGVPGSRGDLMLDLGGVTTSVEIKRRSLVTDDVAERLLAEVARPDGLLLVIADRVTETAGKLLTSRRGGYYDLHGRLALRTDRITPCTRSGRSRSGRRLP